MDNQEDIILPDERHFAEDKPPTNQSQQKPKESDKQNAISLEKQKLMSDVDNLLYLNDSDDEASEDQQKLPEYISVNVKDLRKLLDCQLCNGIPTKVKTIKYCFHRFCGECIDEWLKLGNKVCPVCQTHCPSKAIVEDRNLDGIVAICFPHREEHEDQDEDMQLMDDKGKNPECGVTSTPHSSMSQPIPAAPDQASPYFPSEDMLDRVAKQVVPTIFKHKMKLQAQKRPPINRKK